MLNWLKLKADARIYLGLSEEEFLDLSLIELEYMFDSYNQKQILIDYRFGVLASVIASANAGKNARKYTPDYFFPRLKTLRQEEKELSKEENSALIKERLKSAFKRSN